MLAADRTAEFRTSGDASEQEVQRKIQEERTQAGVLGALSPQQTGAEDEKYGGVNPGFPRTSQYLYEKLPFQQLDGQKRNFPSFRREWTETVTKKYPPEFEHLPRSWSSA